MEMSFTPADYNKNFTAQGVRPAFIVISNPDQRYFLLFPQIDVHEALFSFLPRCQPNVQIVLGLIDAVNEFIRGSGVVYVAFQDVDVFWLRGNLGFSVEDYAVSVEVKNLDSIQPHVKFVPPGGKNCYF